MLKDKLRETDWELTQEAIEEQAARDSYLQWLKDEGSRAHSNTTASGSSYSCSNQRVPYASGGGGGACGGKVSRPNGVIVVVVVKMRGGVGVICPYVTLDIISSNY